MNIKICECGHLMSLEPALPERPTMAPLRISVEFPAQTIGRLAEEAAKLAQQRFGPLVSAAWEVVGSAETSPIDMGSSDPLLCESLERLKAELGKLQTPT